MEPEVFGPTRWASLGLATALAAVFAVACIFAASASAAPAISVSGSQLVDGSGQPVQLRGVNRSGSEWACTVDVGQPLRGYSIFDGPSYVGANTTQPQSMFDAMRSWGINAVRVPVNEHCWLGDEPEQNPAFTGAAYRNAITAYIDQLGANGMYAIIDLHVVGPNSNDNLDAALLPMPDADHAASFWTQVANAFKSRTHVLYDAYNEPNFWEFGGSPAQLEQQWACWRDGCNIDPFGAAPAYTTLGMQGIVNAIRATGSGQPILLGGIGYAKLLHRWLAYKPSDPAANDALVASFHNYPDDGCTDEACWNGVIDPIRLAGFPVVTGELGQAGCGRDYVDRYMNWADAHGGISYLAWTWNETDHPSSGWQCGVLDGGPSVIRAYDGTPTEVFGRAIREHFLARAAPPPGAPPKPVPCKGLKKKALKKCRCKQKKNAKARKKCLRKLKARKRR
jgi:hypothetical protein